MDDADPEVAAAQKRQARAVYRLAEADGCRHERLVGHFGERIAPCRDACDRCTEEDLLSGLPAAPRRGARSRGGAREPAARLEAPDAGLLDALRAWRTRTARARGVPAYVVFSDATLLEIAAARPASDEALLDVKGVGPRKLSDYGEDVLALVRSAAG